MPLLLLLFYFTIISHFALLVVYPMLRNSGHIMSNDFPIASMTSTSLQLPQQDPPPARFPHPDLHGAHPVQSPKKSQRMIQLW